MINNYVDFLNKFKKNKRYEKHYEDFDGEKFDIVITKEFIGMVSEAQVDLLSMVYLHKEIKELLYSINKEYELDNTVFDDIDILDIYEKLYRVKFQLDRKLIKFVDIANTTDRDLNWFDLIIYFDWYKPLDKKYITIAKKLGIINASLLLSDIENYGYKYTLILNSNGLQYKVYITTNNKHGYIDNIVMTSLKDINYFDCLEDINNQIIFLTQGKEIYGKILDYFKNNKDYIGKILRK